MRFSLFSLVLAALLATGATAAGAEESPANVAQLAVSGEAQMQVPADQLRLSVGVITQAVTAEKALQENNRQIQTVAKALRTAGLRQEEMETGKFRVEPQWATPPPHPEPEWRPRIVGYSVINTLHLRTTRLELTGKLIAAAGAAGANQIDELRFDLADPRSYRAEAIRWATANARADAGVLAEAAGVRLLRIVSLQLDPDTLMPLYADSERLALKTAMAEPVVTPGEITVRAAVRLVYEIAQ